MKKRHKILGATLCLIAVVVGGSFLGIQLSGSMKAEYPMYNSVSEMASVADIIVVVYYDNYILFSDWFTKT